MDSYIAKQPIIDAAENTVAYELLFRDSLSNRFPAVNADIATTKLVTEHLVNARLVELLENKPLFINFTEQSLLNELPMQLINQPIVIEILENVTPSDAILEVIKDLKQNGFTIALDDFIYNDSWLRFLPFIDIIKFDISLTSFDEINALLPLIKSHNIKVLIEKIENEMQFKQAKALNSDYFQGYYFAPPEIIQY